jgi:hypothetical protein
MITAAPVFSNPELTASTTPWYTANLPSGVAVEAGTLFENFETCKIYLVGQKDVTKSPAKEITEWWTKNSAALVSKDLITTTYVSSWAIVVDMTWKKAFSAVRDKVAASDNVVPNDAAVDG